MPWLPMYLDKEDLRTIIELLNIDPEIAFIKYNGKNKLRKWIAVEKIQDYDLERYCLWHIPSGPLPLKVYRKDVDEFITNPFEGWEERTSSGNNCCPYFGAGHVGIIWLNNRTGDSNKIGLSSFEWIGNYFRLTGSPAHESTEVWWKNLRKRISKISKKIGRDDSGKPEIFCLEHALKKIESGLLRDINP
jgi:hypothetical protein